MSDRLDFREGSTSAVDDFVARNVHIEDLGGKLFIGVEGDDAYYHFEVVPTRDTFGSSLCCRLMDKEAPHE